MRELLLALLDEVLVDVDADLAHVGEVEQRGEEREARPPGSPSSSPAPRARRRRSVPPMQKPSTLTLGEPAIFARLLERLDQRRDVVVPGDVRVLLLHVAPRDHEHRVALLDDVAHERVLGLQVHDVVLVDAGRHHHQRALVHLRGEWARTGSAGSARSRTPPSPSSWRCCGRPRTPPRRSWRCGPSPCRRAGSSCPPAASRRRSPSPPSAPRGW